MRITCYGDSNTWGFDPRGPFGERYCHPWPELLARKLSCTVINQGENGREIPKDNMQFPEDTDLLVVMLGTNDLLQFWTPEAAAGKMESFLKSLDIASHKILLVSPPPMCFGQWVQDQELIDDSLTLARCYGELAQRLGIRYLDAGQWNLPLAYDGVHLTEEAHEAFANCLTDYIKKECYL